MRRRIYHLLAPLLVLLLLTAKVSACEEPRHLERWQLTDEATAVLSVPADLRGPLVVLLHGGSWAYGSTRDVARIACALAGARYASLAIGYPKLPAVTLAEQPEAVWQAIDSFRRRDSAIAGRPMAILGFSAGAHIAALALLDPGYATARRADAVVGLILLDGTAYDVGAHIAHSPNAARLFAGQETELSPITHLAASDWKGPVLLLFSDHFPATEVQGPAFFKALAEEGFPAEAVFLPGRKHLDFIADWVDPDSAIARPVLDWLARLGQ